MFSTNFDSKKILSIKSEDNLQRQIVKYLKECDLLFCSTLGDTLDSVTRRLNATHKGYTKGIPDLIIYTPGSGYSMFAIEFKSPTGYGNLSKEQHNVCQLLASESNTFVLISNDYTEIIECIIKYTHGLL